MARESESPDLLPGALELMNQGNPGSEAEARICARAPDSGF
jgi:hypothetical protein